jgi:glycosyltransferase involved in cell wall biosynthesis
MRALLVTDSLSPRGGWGRYGLGVTRGLSALGVECRVLMEYRAEPVALPGVRAVPCLSSPMGALDRPRSIAWNAGQLLRHARGADVVHFLVEPYATASLPLGLPPTFLSVHGTYAVSPLHGDRHTRALYRAALRRARAVFCSSRFTREALARRLPLDTLETVPLGLDRPAGVEPPAGEPPRLRGRPILLGVGALKERKGYHVTLRAMARLRGRFPGLRYYLVGDDADRKYVRRLRAEIAALGLERHAEIVGPATEAELRAYYRQADLFILTPINVERGFEGFGLVYLEAGAFGKPVVGSRDCGAEDAVDDGVTGLLAPQHDDEAIAERATAILADPELAGRLGAAGRARAERQTMDAVARRYLEAYRHAPAGRQPQHLPR